MAVNLDTSGESVYVNHLPIEERANNAVYRGVQNLLYDSSISQLLDIGSSDGVINFNNRIDSDRIVGLDLAAHPLLCNTTELAVQADARQLPFTSGVFSHVLALDVLEHLPIKGAIQCLREVARVGALGHIVIVSMPIISPTRVMSYVEYRAMKRTGERPLTGLYDRTHRILAGPIVHRLIFSAAGYRICESYDTVAHTSGLRRISGNRTIEKNHAAPVGGGRQAQLARLTVDLQEVPIIGNVLGHTMGYQRLYVLSQR